MDTRQNRRNGKRPYQKGPQDIAMKRATLHTKAGAGGRSRATLTTPASKGTGGPRASSKMSPFRAGGPTAQAGAAARRTAGLSGRYRPVASSKAPVAAGLPPRRKPSWMADVAASGRNGHGKQRGRKPGWGSHGRPAAAKKGRQSRY